MQQSMISCNLSLKRHDFGARDAAEGNDANLDMDKLSEHSLKDFPEKDPNIYSDKDIKVKFR